MSDIKDPCPEQGAVNPTQSFDNNTDLSQYHDMFKYIEQRFPNFDQMLMAMNNYAYHRFSSLKQSNDMVEFCEMIKKGVLDWYTYTSQIKKVPNVVDLTNEVFDDDTLMNIDKKPSTDTDINKDTNSSANVFSDEKAKINLNTFSMIVPNTKHFYRHVESKSTLEALPQSTQINVQPEKNFKILMPPMTEANTLARKKLPINHDTHFGNDYDRHWWNQTPDTIILNVDISDLVDCVPIIKVIITTIGFKIKMKRSDKWINVLSNQFVKPISKCKWIINKHLHVKLTINKIENKYWSKCLVTETREIDTSNFNDLPYSNMHSSPRPKSPKLKTSTTRKECLENLTKFLQHEYGMEDLDTFIKSIERSRGIITTEIANQPHNSALSMMSSVSPDTVKPLNSDSEAPSNTELSSMDLDVPLKLAESSNSEVTQIQSEPSADLESVKSSSHP